MSKKFINFDCKTSKKNSKSAQNLKIKLKRPICKKIKRIVSSESCQAYQSNMKSNANQALHLHTVDKDLSLIYFTWRVPRVGLLPRFPYMTHMEHEFWIKRQY